MVHDAVEVVPAAAIRGKTRIPGDKAISHRLAMLGSIAEGPTTIHNFAESADCESTLRCLRALGVPITRVESSVTVTGRGLHAFEAPLRELDAGNSGTTVRLMSGILAGQPFESTFVGDASLTRRPMKRIIEPLTLFGAKLTAREENFLPMKIRGGELTAIDYTMPVASGQVKSAILFAGLMARGVTRVREPQPTRNHTEIALREFGVPVTSEDGVIEVERVQALHPATFTVPGDISSAAFLVAAAVALPGSHLLIQDVGVNLSRAGFLSLLQQMGANVRIDVKGTARGEPIADITIEGSDLSGMEVTGDWIPSMIDELPVLAVLGTRMNGGIRIRGAAELRAKESDRIHAIVANLRALGASVEEFPDGLYVKGRQTLAGGIVESFGDHRIAMAFAVAGLFSKGRVVIRDASCVGISFPGFFRMLGALSIVDN